MRFIKLTSNYMILEICDDIFPHFPVSLLGVFNFDVDQFSGTSLKVMSATFWPITMFKQQSL